MTFLNAFLPVILLVALGRFLADRKIPDDTGWRALEQLCFNVLFPAMIILVLSRAPFDNAPWKIVIPLVAAQIIMAVIGLSACFWPGITRPAIASIIQSNSRWNTFIALSLSGVLFGEEGLALTSLAATAMIPAANILSVTALSHFGDNPTGVKRNPFLEIIRNPLVIACAVGLALNSFNLQPSGMVKTILELISQPATTLGLLAAGAGLNLAALTRAGVRTVFWSLVRLFGTPLLAILIASVFFELDTIPLTVIVIAAATPTATSGYILARQLGGDADLMANLIAVETVLAIITLPLILWVFGLMPA